MAIVFDTHKQHKALVEAGFTDPQAQAVTDVATTVLGIVATKADLEIFATKADVALLSTELKSDIARLEAKFDAKFEGVDKALDRMNALMIGQLGATVGGIGIIVGAMFAVIAPHVR
jgi:hypothetical protein